MASVKRQSGLVRRPRPLKRRRRGIRLRQVILLALFLLCAFELMLVALTSAWFHISTVHVEGRHTVPFAAISDGVRAPPKSNIFLFRTDRIARKLEPDPAILKVVVRRKLPDTLVVRLVERTAQLILSTKGSLYEVDSEGVPFRIVDKARPNVPIVSCDVPGRIALGKRLEAPIFLTLRRCLELAEKEKNFRVVKITVDQNNDLCLNVRDGLQIRLGQLERLEEKLDIAWRVVQQVSDVQHGAEYIDVTCPEAPALKLIKAT